MNRLIYDYSDLMEHQEWIKEIPYLSFPTEWKIKMVPPFMGALVRFYIQFKEAHVSIYLDCYDHLGYVGEPYWEIYPDKAGENDRYLMNDTEGLLKAISDSINEQLKAKQ